MHGFGVYYSLLKKLFSGPVEKIHVCSSVPSICSIVQQNSFNPVSVNLVLDESSSMIRSFAFYQKRSSSVKQADLKDVFRRASRSVRTLVMISPEPLALTS
jgi:hypothetical protein